MRQVGYKTFYNYSLSLFLGVKLARVRRGVGIYSTNLCPITSHCLNSTQKWRERAFMEKFFRHFLAQLQYIRFDVFLGYALNFSLVCTCKSFQSMIYYPSEATWTAIS